MLVESFDAQPIMELLDEDPFAASGIEHAGAGGKGAKIAPRKRQLQRVGRIVVPVGTGRAMVLAARRVFTGRRLGPGHFPHWRG